MKECEILGFGSYTDKETGEQKLRIVIAYKSNNDKYFGKNVAAAFLDYDNLLEMQLKNYINQPNIYNAKYNLSEEIGTKTKITNILITEKMDLD